MQLTPSIDASPLDEFLDRMDAVTDIGRDGVFQDACLEASDFYFESERERFDRYSLRGGDWAEHAPSTQKRRGVNATILVDKGNLQDSMSRSGVNHILEVETDKVTEGTQDPKARFHQDGTDKMPARPILADPDQSTLETMQMIVIDGLKKAATEAARGG